MDVMFVKDYIDVGTYNMPVLVPATTIGVLLDEVTSKIYIDEVKITLEFVDKGAYAPLRDDFDEKKVALQTIKS